MALPKEHTQWKRMLFKGNKVWMAVDSTQQPLLENGKTLIKYQLEQPHEYWVHLSSVSELSSVAELTPISEVAAAEQGADRPQANAPKRPARRMKKPSAAMDPQIDSSELPADAITIYTDGACSGNPGPAGIGIVLRYKDRRKEISQYIGQATNNVAELEAIRTALAAIKNRNRPVILHSDSTYALGVLTLGWKAKLNVALVEEIKDLIKTFKHLRFVKVKGHAGNPDNELADRLAVQSIEKGM